MSDTKGGTTLPDPGQPADDAGAGAEAPMRDQPGSGAALLIIDMINSFDFDGGETLKAHALRIVEPIRTLREAARSADIPVIFVNDNFGQWHSERQRIVESVCEEGGEEIASVLAPGGDDYFIIKPQLSGFYATGLPVLLPKLGVRRLVLTGISTDLCVLFTAADAHMRDYALWVPEDAVAAQDNARHRAALAIMRDGLGARTDACAAQALTCWSLEKTEDGRG